MTHDEMAAHIRRTLRQERRHLRLRRVVAGVKLSGLVAALATTTALSLGPIPMTFVGH